MSTPTPPTISSVTPAAGRTTGRILVKIAGTRFRLPPAPAATGYVGGEQPRSVAVSFGGIACDWAYAASSTLILARVPAWTGPYDQPWPLSVDVRVANLDSAGHEITGENATRKDGYEYTAPDLVGEPYLQRALRAVVALVRRHFGIAVWLTFDPEYTDSPAEQARLLAAAPVLHLIGPTAPLNRFNSLNREEAVDDPHDASAYLRALEPVVVDVGLEVRCYARTMRHLLALGQAFSLFSRDVVDLPVTDAVGTVKTYEAKCPFDGQPEYNTEPSAVGLLSWSARFVIEGVHLDEDGGSVVERGWRTTANDGEPSLDAQASRME